MWLKKLLGEQVQNADVWTWRPKVVPIAPYVIYEELGIRQRHPFHFWCVPDLTPTHVSEEVDENAIEAD